MLRMSTPSLVGCWFFLFLFFFLEVMQDTFAFCVCVFQQDFPLESNSKALER